MANRKRGPGAVVRTKKLAGLTGQPRKFLQFPVTGYGLIMSRAAHANAQFPPKVETAIAAAAARQTAKMSDIGIKDS